MPEGGRGVRVRMTNNVEGCMKKHDRGGGGGGGGGKKMPQDSMTSLNLVIYHLVTMQSLNHLCNVDFAFGKKTLAKCFIIIHYYWG